MDDDFEGETRDHAREHQLKETGKWDSVIPDFEVIEDDPYHYWAGTREDEEDAPDFDDDEEDIYGRFDEEE